MGKDRETNKLQVEDLENRVAPLVVVPSDPDPAQPVPTSVDTSNSSGTMPGKGKK